MFRLLIVIPFILGLLACSTQGDKRRAEYLEADYLTRLELPPDLIYEDSIIAQSQLKLPEPTSKARKLFKAGLAENATAGTELISQDNLAAQVAPVFEDIRLESADGLYWLEVDRNAKEIWPVLIDFWQHEGVRLSRVEPLIGFMETDWLTKYQVNENDNFFSKLVAIVDKDKSDRFRLRVVAKTPSQTKIFVSHTGLQNIIDGEDSFHFGPRPSESALEVEILTRLLVFMGLTQQDAVGLLHEYRPFSQRALKSASDDYTIAMTGTMEFVWSRALRALDRLGLDVAEKNISQHELKVVIQKLSAEQIGGERDEIAEASFIMQWFSGANKDASKDDSRQFILKFNPQPKAVDIQVLDLKREPAESVLAEQLIKGLLIELN